MSISSHKLDPKTSFSEVRPIKMSQQFPSINDRVAKKGSESIVQVQPNTGKSIKNCVKKGLSTFGKILILSGLVYSILAINNAAGHQSNTLNNNNDKINTNEIRAVGVATFIKTDQNIEKEKINKPKDDADQIPIFVQKYLREMKEIQQRRFSFDKRQVGEWKELGCGSAKITYVHPALPDYVIKFPRAPRYVANIKRHYDNLQIATKIIEESHYHHLVLPETHLITSLKWPILIEKRLYFEKSNKINSKIIAQSKNQLNNFLEAGNFCDINIDLGNNAKYLENTGTDPKIGIFDLDCIEFSLNWK